jgi:hypothetical protein
MLPLPSLLPLLLLLLLLTVFPGTSSLAVMLGPCT